MRKIQMVDLATQYNRLKPEIDAALQDVIQSTAFINGPAVKAFSRGLADYIGVPTVIPCANGTDALQIALMALGLQPGDEVITTPFTFVATAEVIALLKLKPVFVDIGPDTFNLDVNKLEALITERTKAIIPVHLFGQSCNMEPIMQLAEKHNLYVIEDNAQSTGSDYTFSDGNTVKTGAIGHIGCTSFYPTKNLGGYGDGGAISVKDEEIAHQVFLIANHGSDRKYYYDAIGVNSRLDAMQAAILNVKLNYLDAFNDSRRKAADLYDELLNGIAGIEIPFRSGFSRHVFHQYTIKVKQNRDELQQFLRQYDIPSMVYYPVPLHISKAYADFGYSAGDFPVAEAVAKEVISLPMHSELDEEQIRFITDKVIEFVNK
jgi:UDP-2-acetamido-2-deoxy-ribo-hexuluronate aminotransferase